MISFKQGAYIGILVYMAVWIVLSIILKNYEFLFYLVALILLLAVIWKTDKIFNYSGWSVAGFLVWSILHFVAGELPVGDTVLYGAIIIPIVDAPYNILSLISSCTFFAISSLLFL